MKNKIKTIEICLSNMKSEKMVYDSIWYRLLVMNYADYQNNNLKLRQISTSNPESHKVILIVSPNCKIVDIVEQVMSIINDINGIESVNITYYDMTKLVLNSKVKIKTNVILLGAYNINKFTDKDADTIKKLIDDYLYNKIKQKDSPIGVDKSSDYLLNSNSVINNPLTNIYDDYTLDNNTIAFELYEPLNDSSSRHLKIKVNNISNIIKNQKCLTTLFNNFGKPSIKYEI